MKFSRKLLSFLLIFTIISSITLTTFADSPDISQDTKQSFSMLYTGPATRSTWYGDAGTATLDYVSAGRCFAITFTEFSGTAFTIAGEITIYQSSNGKYVDTLYFSVGGVGGTSGMVPVNPGRMRFGTGYKAYFTGTGTNALNQTFTINPGASIPFVYT